jgi:hypothetical protein
LKKSSGKVIREKNEKYSEKRQWLEKKASEARNERFGPPILLVFPILPSCFGRSNCAFLHFASNLARVEAARFARAVMRGRCTLVEKQSMKTKEIM